MPLEFSDATFVELLAELLRKETFFVAREVVLREVVVRNVVVRELRFAKTDFGLVAADARDFVALDVRDFFRAEVAETDFDLVARDPRAEVRRDEFFII